MRRGYLLCLPLTVILAVTSCGHGVEENPDQDGAVFVPVEETLVQEKTMSAMDAEPGLPNQWIAFRKDINIEEVPSEAPVKVAADSKYWLWVNGGLAVFEGGLKRGPNPRDTYFDEVDLAPFLTRGENKIAVLLEYFGTVSPTRPATIHSSGSIARLWVSGLTGAGSAGSFPPTGRPVVPSRITASPSPASSLTRGRTSGTG